LVIEDLHDKHKQEFLKGHDMEISSIAVSSSGKILATGQLGT
jgi:WD40 repeat protein